MSKQKKQKQQHDNCKMLVYLCTCGKCGRHDTGFLYLVTLTRFQIVCGLTTGNYKKFGGNGFDYSV